MTFTSKDDFIYLDHPEYMGRCYSVPMPNNTDISQVFIYGTDEIDVRFHEPGNYYNSDYKFMHVQPDMSNDVDLNNEVFELLDFDGKKCKTYTISRDDCVENYITNKIMDKIGCNVPFLPTKENICTEQNKALEAFKYYKELKELAYTDNISDCPKPCKYFMIDFGRSSSTIEEDGESKLIVGFRKYIKVSKVSYTYQGLELFAEVGGYLGLCLGISISQLPGLIVSLMQKCNRK